MKDSTYLNIISMKGSTYLNNINIKGSVYLDNLNMKGSTYLNNTPNIRRRVYCVIICVLQISFIFYILAKKTN
jgi:hypothetical protein